MFFVYFPGYEARYCVFWNRSTSTLVRNCSAARNSLSLLFPYFLSNNNISETARAANTATWLRARKTDRADDQESRTRNNGKVGWSRTSASPVRTEAARPEKKKGGQTDNLCSRGVRLREARWLRRKFRSESGSESGKYRVGICFLVEETLKILNTGWFCKNVTKMAKND